MARHGQSGRQPVWQLGAVFLTALKLGCRSFGGPVAHLAWFRQEYVERQAWISEAAFARLLALCQFLPGPASSQLGMGIGMYRAGLGGALAAWLGFTLPSALLMVLFSVFLGATTLDLRGLVAGCELAAVAVVAHAVLGMWQKLVLHPVQAGIAILGVLVLALANSAAGQMGVMAGGALAGLLFHRISRSGSAEAARPAVGQGGSPSQAAAPATVKLDAAARPGLPVTALPRGRLLAVLSLGLLVALFAGLAVLQQLLPANPLARLAAEFYRTGSLVFGGGHVVLPLLEQQVVEPGLVGLDRFLAGYGVVQAMPGPLFSFSAFLGMEAAGWPGALVGLVAIFLPSFLFLAGVLPWWDRLAANPWMQAAMWGMNAAVTGILLSALYHPVWTNAIRSPLDFGCALGLFALLKSGRVPSWAVLVLGLLAGVASHLAA